MPEVLAYQVPDTWVRCIACSDYKRRPGQMWLGHTASGTDILIDCPACGGKGQVLRYKYVCPVTGKELREE